MKNLIIAVVLACFAGVAFADEIKEIDKKVIEAYLRPDNNVPFIDLYTQMTGKKFADVKDHIKFLQNISAVKNVWNQVMKEDKDINNRVVEAFLKPRNKLFLVDLYVKMTGFSYDVAIEKCKFLADNNAEVKTKWNKQSTDRKKQIGLKEVKRNECDGYLRQARALHPTINYKQHNKCIAYNDSAKLDDYSERKDYKQTLEECLDTEVEFAEKFNEFEGLLDKQQTCNNELLAM
jgi:hypothetical protein